MAALVIAEHDNASLKPATLNTVTAAAACGGEVHVLVAGQNAGAAAQTAAQVAGVTKVLHANADGLAHGLAENVAAKWQIGREAQDRFSAESQRKTEAAQAAGRYRDEIVSVTTTSSIASSCRRSPAGSLKIAWVAATMTRSAPLAFRACAACTSTSGCGAPTRCATARAWTGPSVPSAWKTVRPSAPLPCYESCFDLLTS